MSYHLSEIKKGVYGELSKVQEELEEAIDASWQNNRVMVLVELSDVVGAISGYLKQHFSDITIDDLVIMSEATKRAFETGHRIGGSS